MRYQNLLLPHRFKKAGWCLLVPAAILGIFTFIPGAAFPPPLYMKVFTLLNDGVLGTGGGSWFIWTRVDVMPTLIGSLVIAGGLLVGFSREQMEDEFIGRLRLSALLWSVLLHYLMLLLAFLTVYGFYFIDVMLFNMFTVLILFIARFHYLLYVHSKMPDYEK